MTLNYSKEKNDALVNPFKYYSRYKGVHYHKTIMATDDDVNHDDDNQPRTVNQDVNNFDGLVFSHETKNYDHNFRPMAADIEKINEMYDGVSGWNRKPVYKFLEIPKYPLDLLSFDSEYDKHKFREAFSNNQPEHHTAAAKQSQVSIRESIKKMIRKGWLNDTSGVVTDKKIKEEIIDYTTVVIDGVPAQTVTDGDRKQLLKDIRSSFPKNNKVQTYNKELIKLAMKSLDLPYGGYDTEKGTIGYVLTHTVGKDGLWNMIFANGKATNLPVNITFALPVPPDNKNKCVGRRKALVKSLNDVKELFAKRVSDIFGIDLDEAKAKVEALDINFIGFLNSYVDEAKAAGTQFCIVDENGNLIKPKVKIPSWL